MKAVDSLEETTVIIANTARIVAKGCIGLEHAKTYMVTMYLLTLNMEAQLFLLVTNVT
jgi:hypothetical protein